METTADGKQNIDKKTMDLTKDSIKESVGFSLSKRLAMFTSDVPGCYAKKARREAQRAVHELKDSIESPSAKRVLTETAIARRYEIKNLIGEGGMGKVFEAHDHELGRLVAIKILKADAVEEIDDVHRFYYEAEILARMDHPGILPIMSAGMNCSVSSMN